MNAYAIDDLVAFQSHRSSLESFLKRIQWDQKASAVQLLQVLAKAGSLGTFDEDAYLASAGKLWDECPNLARSDRAALFLLLTRFHALVREFPVEPDLYPVLYEAVLQDPQGFSPSNRVLWGDFIFNGLVYQIEQIRGQKSAKEAKNAVLELLIQAQSRLQKSHAQALVYTFEWILQQPEPLSPGEKAAFRLAFANNAEILRLL